MGIGLGLGIQFYKKAGARLSAFLTWGQSVPARFWGTETPEYWGGIDPQAQIAYDSLIAAGFTTPQGLGGINAAFSVVKEIYGTSDITTAISFFGDPSLAYEAGAGTGTTAGQAIRTLPNIIDPTRATDAVQTTAASQPLLLVHSGANYAWLPKVAGNFFSSPSSTASNLRSNFEFIAYGLNLHTLTGDSNIYGRFNTNQYQSIFGINSSLQLYLSVSIDGINILSTYTSTVALPTTSNISVKVTRVQSTGEIKFFTNIGSGWNQLGSTIIGTTSLLFNSTSAIQIGTYINGNIGMLGGSILRVTAANAIDGAPVVDFNPSQYNASVSQTQWTSSTGEVWTINTGTATTGYKGVLVDRTIMQSDGVDDFIVTSTIPSQQYYTSFVAATLYTNPNTAPRLLSGNGDSHLIFKTGANAFEAFNGLQMAFTGESINTSLMWIVDYNSTSSKTWINNANETSGSTGTNTSNRLSLFGGVTGATLSNATISTIVRPTALANNTQRTAMYNYIRSINNAAF